MNSFQQNYLMDFGYLPKSNIETGNLRTEAQLREAIKSFQVSFSLLLFLMYHQANWLHLTRIQQRFGNIPETGRIDDRTRYLMQSPRCGVADNQLSKDFLPEKLRRSRHKRYVIQGSKWDHLNLTWRWVCYKPKFI